MASDSGVHSKQNEATCSNKTKRKYKPTVTQSIRHILFTKQHKAQNPLQKLTEINY